MSDWEGRLKAVASLAQPPVYQDGEVVCLNPTCRNQKLNRADKNCWRCGLDRFAPASEEMRHALRFNYVPPPRMVEPPKEVPTPGFAAAFAQAYNSIQAIAPTPQFWYMQPAAAPPPTPVPTDLVEALADAITMAEQRRSSPKSNTRAALQQEAHEKRMAQSQPWAEHLSRVLTKRDRAARPSIKAKKRGWSR